MEAYVEWTDGKGEVHSLHLLDRIYIGRKCQGIPDDKKIVVDNPHVSKDHAVLTNTGGRIVAYDMSRNGTYVNGARITPGVEHPLQDGDIVAVGNCSMRVVVKELAPAFGRMAAAEETMTISSQVVVTNLVADVRGYTAYSQKLDSAVMYEAMKEIFDDFSRIVQKHRGVVMDYAGDAIFAVWEHGEKDDPARVEQACRAAMEQCASLVAIVERITRSHEGFSSLQMGWGITTGGVTLSHYGVKKDYRAIVGDCTNYAFRLSKQANKNLTSMIVVCQRTAEDLGGRIPLKEIGEVETEGREGKEKVFGIVL